MIKFRRSTWTISSIVFLLTLQLTQGYAQITLSTPILSAQTVTATHSIILNPGFSVNGINGTVILKIVAPPVLNCVPLAAIPSASQNYVMTLTPRQPFTDASILYSKKTCEVMQTIQYFDGLGRPIQTVTVKGNPSATADVVQPVAYDPYGREVVKYLSYTATTAEGSYKTDALTAGAGVSNFYNPGRNGVSGNQQANGVVINPSPYMVTNFEQSPLNRATEQGAPGNDWQPVSNANTGHTNKFIYATNDAPSLTTGSGYWARLYNVTINSDQSRTLVDNGVTGYGQNQLNLMVMQDENWSSNQPDTRLHTTETYTDKEGHTLLKRTFNYNSGNQVEILSTYYVYDDQNNLAFVLPPGANADNGLSSAGNQTVLDNLCYQYQYDQRNLLSQKKLPGKDWEYMVHNVLDQVIATQDGNQRVNNQWVFTKYDVQGRVMWTGLWNNNNTTISRPELQSILSGITTNLWESRPTGGYPTNTAWPTSGFAGNLTVNYYDDYSFPDLPYDYRSLSSSMTTGLLTCTKTWVFGSSAVLYKVIYYDDLGRTIRTYAQHYLGGTTGVNDAANYDTFDNTYNFNNQLTGTVRNHYTTTNTSAAKVVVGNSYYYDHMGRKTQTWETVFSGNPVNAIVLSQNEYNEIGQLKAKHLHSTNSGSSFLQDINYAYNERGWLKTINDPTVALTTNQLFAEQLNYNLAQYGAATQYNGNIAEQLYGVYNSPAAGLQTVTYGYDPLNRLTAGNSSTGYSETGITYDLNGNIKSLNRTSPNSATLAYNYNGNQLITVTNSGSSFRSYGYDQNGNATSDGQGNTVNYNMFNLPQSMPGKGLSYVYDATGDKLRKLSNNGPTDYINEIQYKSDAATIDFIQTEEGRAINNGGIYTYEYTLKDHLGNNRVTFDQTNGKVGEDDYYPFGLNIHRQQNAGDKYLYNGKELQEELTQYDYGARFYDPVLGRWTTPDPLAEISRRWSPYVYGENNPIRMIDPDGMRAVYNWGTGTYEDGGKEVSWGEVQEQYGINQDNGGDKKKKTNTDTKTVKVGSSTFFSELWKGYKAGWNEGMTYVPGWNETGVAANSYSNGNIGAGTAHYAMAFGDVYFTAELTSEQFLASTGAFLANLFKKSITKEISAFALEHSIFSGQTGINSEVVEEYVNQMKSKTFDPAAGVGGFINKGKYILTEGNHKMVAAIKYGLETGNFKYVEQIMEKGRFTYGDPAAYGVKVYNLPVGK